MARDIMKDLSFGDMLITPGYEVVFAIGTTYSLSLDALLSVPIAFGMLDELNESTRNNPYYILESIRRSSDKFVLFCNQGGIAVPNDIRNVYSLLECSIFEVFCKDNPTANFHPKVWIIKERNKENEGDLQMKVIVMSRNLTFDNSLDVAATLTAKIRDHTTKYAIKHVPLKTWVEWLMDYASTERSHKMREILEDIDCLDAFNVDEPFENYDFYPIIYGKKDELLERAMQGSSMAIISPFIDITTLRRLNKRCTRGRKLLITRKEYVDKAIFNEYTGDNDEIYAVNDSMIDNDFGAINLHAKIYVVSYPLIANAIYLFLGSANATFSAFDRNSEFLLRLQFKRGQHVMDRYLNEFINDKEKCFEPLTEPGIEEREQNEYSKAELGIKALLNAGIKAKAIVDDNNGKATVKITCKVPKNDVTYKLAPLQALGLEQMLNHENVFKDLDVIQLSEFYKLTAICKDDEVMVVVKIRTRGIPENRNQLILQSIVNTKEKFLNYVALMLSDDAEDLLYEIERLKKSRECKTGDTTVSIALYERLLSAAYNNPKQLEDINKFVMDMKSSGNVDESFLQMYDKFMKIIKQLKRI